MNKKTKKKLILAALAALASGGVIYAVRKSKEEEEGEEKSGEGGNVINVGPSSSGDGEILGSEGYTEEEILGGTDAGGGGFGGGGGGGGANMTLCRGLDEEGNEKANLVNAGEECPADTPYSEDIEYDDFVYDSFNCFAYDEETEEIIAQEKDFSEVCGVDYPDFPFDTLNDALSYAQDPSAFDGCTDESALNYDETAMVDDGSCIMEGDEVQGCTNEDALNFDEFANVDDGTCQFGVTRDEISNVAVDCGVDANQGIALINLDAIAQVDGEDILALDEVNDIIGFECYNALGEVIVDNQEEEEVEPVLGCTDPEASNYNPEATEDDGTCNLMLDPMEGCTDSTATNYNPDAELDDGSCQYDVVEIEGCTDATAINFNADATIDDGSCQYDVIEVQGCTDPTAINFDSDATQDDGTCEYEAVVQPEQRTCYFFDDQQTIMEAYFDLLPDETCWNDVAPLTSLTLIPTTRNGYFDSVDDAVAYLTGMASFGEEEAPPQMCIILDPSLPYPEGMSEQELPSDFEQCDDAFGEFSYPLTENTESQAEPFLTQLHQEYLLENTFVCYAYDEQGVFEQDTLLIDSTCENEGLFTDQADAQNAYDGEFGFSGLADAEYLLTNFAQDCPYTDLDDLQAILASGGSEFEEGLVSINDINTIIGYECYDPNTGLVVAPPMSDFGCTDSTASNYDPDAVIDSGTCEYEPTAPPVGFLRTAEVSQGIYQNCNVGWDELQDLLAIGGEFISINDINNIVGWECYASNGTLNPIPADFTEQEPESLGDTTAPVDDSQGDDTLVPNTFNEDETFAPDDSGNDEVVPIDFGEETTASVDNSAILTSAQLDTLDACPTTFSGSTLEILTATSISAREANEILGTACFDEVTGENLYYEAPAENLILSGNEAMELFFSCIGGTLTQEFMAVAPLISSASYPLSAQDFNSTLGFNCLDVDTAEVVNPLVTPEPEMPSSQVDSGTSAPTGGGSTSPQDVIDDNTLTPQPDDALVSDFDDIGIDNDILADANTPPSTIVGQSSQDLNTENSLNSLGQRKRKNFSGQGLQNGGCLDPIALNYDEFAEFDDGTCMY